MDRSNPIQQSNLINLYLGFLPRPMDPFPDLVIAGLLSRLHHYQKKLLVIGEAIGSSADELFDYLFSPNIEGLIFIPPAESPLVNKLAQSGRPVIAIADRAPGIVSVVVDNQMGAFMLAEHLALRGHRKVLFRKDLYSHESAVSRFTAFEKAAQYLGIEVIGTLPIDPFGNLSTEERSFLLDRSAGCPTAVVCWVDTYTYPVLKFCKANGLNVPKDVALAGFDGITFPIEPARRLTTIQAPWLRVAETAADLLMQLINEKDVPRETVLPVDLVMGDTT